MKRLLSFLSCALVLMLAGCTSDDVRVENPGQGLTSNLRTPEEAVALAKSLYQSRHNSRADVSVADVAVIGSSASRAGADTLIYAVNFADNQGFTLISAAKVGIDVIGFTEEGIYNQEEADENPNFSFYMDKARTYVRANIENATINSGGGTIGPINPNLPCYRFDFINPRVSVKWGQRYPEGSLCPNGISGCVQTAMAQIFSYIEKPTSIIYTCGEFPISVESINWSQLARHTLSYDYETEYSNHFQECEATNSNHDAIGRICRELGYRNDATYYSNSTGASSYTAHNTMQSLLSSNQVSEFKNFSAPYENLFNELISKDCIAYVRANSNVGGHAWVCDGGEDMVKITKDLSYTGEWITHEEHSIQYHFNWGWNGLYNGYYNAGVFSVDEQNIHFTGVEYFVIYK